MAYAMTKLGSLDNCITYEFICDTVADMNAIENAYRTIGTVAVVLTGESDGLEVYIAGSDKQWNSLSTTSGSNSGDTTGLSIYICSQNEVNQGLPNISEPDETNIYLVASGQTSGNLYEEYIYVNNNWEKFGAASIDLSNYATKSEIAGFYTKPSGGIPDADLAHTYLTSHLDISGLAPKESPVFTGSISLGRKSGSIVGANSSAVGLDTIALATYSHAEGNNTTASDNSAHAEGLMTVASGVASHAEGRETKAISSFAHAEGQLTRAYGTCSHAEGYGGAFTKNSTTHTAQAAGFTDHTEGYQCLTALGNTPGNHAEGFQTMATGGASHSEGAYTTASGYAAHAEGYTTEASGQSSHTEGQLTKATGVNAHAEGYGGTFTINSVLYISDANGYADHIEGYQCYTESALPGNHAEGYRTKATGGSAHSEGANTHAKGIDSHAEGSYTQANGSYSHTEGVDTIANGMASHVGGVHNVEDNFDNWPEWTANTSYVAGDKVKVTTTTNNVTTVHGYTCRAANNNASFSTLYWNLNDYMNYAEIIGNGLNEFNRSNAYALDWDGTGHFAGDVYVGCNTDSTGGTKVATLTDLNFYAPKADPIFTGTVSVAKLKCSAGGNASGDYSVALGAGATASGSYSVALGGGTTASGEYDFAHGGGSRATGGSSHAEGTGCHASGMSSHAEGGGNTAAGTNSHAEGGGTHANGPSSHTEGGATYAEGVNSHAEGGSTHAVGAASHAEGGGTYANGWGSHSEGNGTIANGDMTHVAGLFNVEDNLNSWSEWVANTSYSVGDKVKVTTTEDNVTTILGYKCKTANNDANFTASKWDKDGYMNYAEIIGNGTSSNARSNAYALDWNGTGHFAGDVYVECNEDSTGGAKVAKVSDIPDTSTLAPKENPIFSGYATVGTLDLYNTSSARKTLLVGDANIAMGARSMIVGEYNRSDSFNSLVSGKYNFNTLYDDWVAGKSYKVGDIVFYIAARYKCITDNNDDTFTGDHWITVSGLLRPYAVLVGNGTGTADSARSNAYRLDWDGSGYYGGDIYVNCDRTSKNGSKVATEAFVTARVPAPPVADGTYNLQVSVSSGTATYSWVAAPGSASGVNF